eukprot:TRINITY_DN4869_c0_g2_i4.p1 TRINITY_DN4869_c0_g2~~TRINITY_DN4869_c0_g2_i4.p1  ORF type:complete len:132 (-),score=51.53 TRINITY_DN4869_c0_g2_i4:1400-1795(-)
MERIESGAIAGSSGGGGGGGDEEVERLRAAVTELRELLNYQTKEKEVAEAKIQIANAENDRNKAAFAQAQQKLQQAREQLAKRAEVSRAVSVLCCCVPMYVLPLPLDGCKSQILACSRPIKFRLKKSMHRG